MSKSTPKLVLNRNYTLTSTLGHSIEFVKGVPTHVPPAMYRAALEIGAMPADGESVDVLEDSKPAAPIDPAERAELIMMAIKDIVARNEREDFTAAGAPSVQAVTKAVGFKVASSEIAAQWQLHHEQVQADALQAQADAKAAGKE